MSQDEAPEEPTASTPLLDRSDNEDFFAGRTGWRHRRPFVIGVLFVMLASLLFGLFVALPAQNQIFQDIICRQMHASAGADTGTLPDCKSEPVQSELGYVIGWKETFESAPGIFLAIPYGILADSRGRRPVLLIALSGVLLAEAAIRVICAFPEVLPLRAVWLAELLSIGGGFATASSMVITIISDLFSPAERTTVFSIVITGELFSQMFGAPVGAALVEHTNPWIPYLMGPMFLVFSMGLIILLPETKPKQVKKPVVEIPPPLRERMSVLAKRAAALPRAAAANPAVTAAAAVTLVGGLGKQTSDFVVLSASKRFGWTLAQAAYLYSVRSVVTLVLLLLVIPAATHLLVVRAGVSAPFKDLVLTRILLACSLVGCVAIGLAPAPPAFVLGVAVLAGGTIFYMTARCLALALVDRSQYATLNSICSVIQSIGMIVSGPILAAAWHRGLLIGDLALGMPFFVSAGMFALACVTVLLVRVQKYDDPVVNDDDRNGPEAEPLLDEHDGLE